MLTSVEGEQKNAKYSWGGRGGRRKGLPS